MGYAGKLAQKDLAIRLRGQGLSYKEILHKVPVSKDTISRWCKNIQLTPEQKSRLAQNKQFGQRKGSQIAAENKRAKRIADTEAIYSDAKKLIGAISQRDQFLIGIALYAGEGYKQDGKVGFANADPRLISFMMQWFLTFCKIPMDRIRGAIWIHEGLDDIKAKEFWSGITNIPVEQFHKTYVVQNKHDSKKIRKNIHAYGIFTIRFVDTRIHRQVMGWISAILGDRITSIIRDSSMVEQVAVNNRSSY